MTEEEVWDALKFWAMLGDVLVQKDVLITDLNLLIALMRPIVHHAPLRALQNLLSGAPTACDEHTVPGFVSSPRSKQNEVRWRVEALERQRKLHFELLEDAAGWCDLQDKERRAAVELLEASQLIVRSDRCLPGPLTRSQSLPA
jgi:hypothetical protein